MATNRSIRIVAPMAMALLLLSAAARSAGAQETPAALKVDSARVTVNGTSNIHAFTASTSMVKVMGLKAAATAEGETWDALLAPGGIETFEIAFPAASLGSAKGDIDKNMHKALKVTQHPDIVFTLRRLEAGDAASARATGTLRIAGVEKEIVLPLTLERSKDALKVTGAVPVVMTEFGVVPPKAMMGMLRTDSKVTVAFEITLVH